MQKTVHFKILSGERTPECTGRMLGCLDTSFQSKMQF